MDVSNVSGDDQNSNRQTIANSTVPIDPTNITKGVLSKSSQTEQKSESQDNMSTQIGEAVVKPEDYNVSLEQIQDSQYLDLDLSKSETQSFKADNKPTIDEISQVANNIENTIVPLAKNIPDKTLAPADNSDNKAESAEFKNFSAVEQKSNLANNVPDNKPEDDFITGTENSNINNEVSNPNNESFNNVSPVQRNSNISSDLNENEKSLLTKTQIKEETVPLVEKNISTESNLSNIKKIALVCLYSESINDVSTTELNSLIPLLYKNQIEIIIDSTRGYFVPIKEALKMGNFKGVFLDSFFAKNHKDSQNASEDMSFKIFSNLFEKQYELFRESDLFIVPETQGVINYSFILNILSTIFLYKDMAKPVIFLGASWQNKIGELISLIDIAQDEFTSFFKIAQNSSQVFEFILEYDKNLLKFKSNQEDFRSKVAESVFLKS